MLKGLEALGFTAQRASRFAVYGLRLMENTVDDINPALPIMRNIP